ncbi:MAG: GAF domain-containing protein [Nitrospirae bacterium]|nr:GAF domain-containing protein [Nitrospirota bacterium]
MKMTKGTIANIERAKKEWESTFDAVSDLISIHDNKFRIIRANKACARKFNISPKELIGRHCYELFHGTVGPIDECPQAKSFQTGENTHLEWADPRTGTTYDISVYPLFDDDNKVRNIIHVVKDITMLKRVEKELRTLNEKMLQRNRDLHVAIEKAREEAEISKDILAISREVMDVMDPAFLLKNVAVISSKMFNPDIIMTFLWNKDREIYVQVSATGAEHVLSMNPDNFPPLGEVLRTKSLIFIENGDDPLLHQGVISSLPLNAMSIIPFLVRNKVVGFIINCYYSPRSFTFKDRHIMEGMGYQISLALNNAYLYRDSMEKTMELSYKVETIEVMHEIDRGILALINRNEILEKVSYMLGNLIPCNGIIILLMDNEANGFRYAAGWGIELPKGEITSFDDINYSEFLKPPRIVVRTELKAEDIVPFDSKLYKMGVRSDIRIPLFSGNEVAGVLNILSHRIAGFTTSQLNTIEMIASQISVALDNARLVEDLQELLIGTTISLAGAIEAKSPWTKGHSERVTEYAMTIGRQMGLTEKELENVTLQ